MRTTTSSRIATTSIRHRVAAALFAAGALLVFTAGPAAAQGSGGQAVRDKISDLRVGVGDVTVAKGERLNTPVVAVDGSAFVDGSTTKDVYVVSGNAVITGKVGGSVVVLDGNAQISGNVTDNVVALRGRAIIEDGAVVGGDVRSSKEPRVGGDATVRGDVKTIDVTGMFTALGFSLLFFFWLAVTVSTAILGAALLALFGRPFDKAAETARTAPGKSIGWGVLLAIGLPVLAVAAMFSLVGLPLGLGTAGALGVLGTLGYLTSALCLGRLMIKAPRNIFGAFFAGWAILRVLALLPGLGALVWAGASVFGVGAMVVAAWRASHGPLPEAALAADVTSAAPAPAEPADEATPTQPAPSDAADPAPTKTASKATKATKTTKTTKATDEPSET